MEQIVGDIDDEHADEDVQMLRVKTTDGQVVWDVDARAAIDEFEKKFGREIATDEQEDDVDTLGGLVFTLAGRVPERGKGAGDPAADVFSHHHSRVHADLSTQRRRR